MQYFSVTPHTSANLKVSCDGYVMQLSLVRVYGYDGGLQVCAYTGIPYSDKFSRTKIFADRPTVNFSRNNFRGSRTRRCT